MNEMKNLLLDEFILLKVKEFKKEKRHNTNWNCANEHTQAKVCEREREWEQTKFYCKFKMFLLVLVKSE